MSANIIDLGDFQLIGGQLDLYFFSARGVMCLFLMIMTLTHYAFDWNFISCALMHYVDTLFQRPRLIMWFFFF